MNVLVTGGAGFIGGHVAMALRDAGFKVSIVDNLVHAQPQAMEKLGFEVVVADVRDVKRMISDIAMRDINAIVHCAGIASVQRSIKFPIAYYENNLAGTISIAAAARETGNVPIVFSSSCSVYGDATGLIDETYQTDPITPYGRSKLFAEQVLVDAQLRHFSFRYFNAAGASPLWNLGDIEETRLIPAAVASARGGAALTIAGTDWPTPDGTCVRDYVDVHDIAKAHVIGVRKLLDGHHGGVFNLGRGVGVSVAEVAATVEGVVRRPVRTEIGPRRPGDPAILVCDPAKAISALGWRPEREVAEMVLDHFDWVKP